VRWAKGCGGSGVLAWMGLALAGEAEVEEEGGEA